VLAGASGCGSSHHPRKHRSPPPQTPAQQLDSALLNGVLDIEYRAVALYTAAVPLLRGFPQAVAKLFLQQELAHVTLLQSIIGDSNGKPDKQRYNYDFGKPHGLHGLFDALAGFENEQVAGYLDVITQLSTGGIRASIASIMANDAQHLSVATLLLGRNPVPTGFVIGNDAGGLDAGRR
jgi:hypothetical protein